MNSLSTQLQVKLISTSACHLCDEAEAILHHAGINISKLDILDEDKLFDKYSLRIPVLKRFDNGEELDWPFDTASVLRFLIV